MGYAMNFTGKRCVITGAARGIGLCILRQFATRGARCAFIDTDATQGDKIAAELKKTGTDILFCHGDISEETTLRDFARRVGDHFGQVDIVVNNACTSRGGILSHCSFDDFNYVLRVGVSAPYLLAELFFDSFAPSASIVNISSTRSIMSQPDTESYSAAKGAISALTHALAVSLSGIARVNSISPGWIDTASASGLSYSSADTAQHPSRRIGVPMDIANAVLFLCDDANSFINGENITIDGGMSRQMIYHNDHGWHLDT